MGTSPIEYFRCRRERGQIGCCGPGRRNANPFSHDIEWNIRDEMPVHGIVSSRPRRPLFQSNRPGLYYGVDTGLFRPSRRPARRFAQGTQPASRKIHHFSFQPHQPRERPRDRASGRGSCRQKGLNAVVINLGGGFQDFLNLARQLVGNDADSWVLGRPAAHPMGELAGYYQAADCLAQASLAEGLGLSPLEALACGTPAVCTAVGGLTHLKGYARLTPKRDPEAMCREFLWLAANRGEARRQASEGREFVVREWSREKAFADLTAVFAEVICKRSSENVVFWT